MQITLANPRGFCAGVQVAIDIVDQVLDAMKSDENLYVYHVKRDFHMRLVYQNIRKSVKRPII